MTLSSTSRPAIRGRVISRLPATLQASGGLQVEKLSGVWTFSPDWTVLALETTIPDPENRQIWTLDPSTDSYTRISVQALIDSLPPGPSGTITVGTSTGLAAGASPTVANSGDENDAIFDFGFPRGADAGMRYAFESSTSMAAPASGGLRLNNAALASVTAMAVNAINSDGVDISDFVATWDDSTSSVKAYVEVRKEGSGAALGIYQLTGVTDNTTWLQLALTYVSGSGSFTAADALYVTPYRTGNAGSNGAVAVSGTPTVNQFAAWVDSATIKGVSITGLVKGNGASAPTAAVAGTDYEAVDADILRADVSKNLIVGFTTTSFSNGTKSSGTFTPDAANGGVQHYTNGGAHTLAPQSASGTIILECVNASAGALTTSGFTIVDGDTYSSSGTKKHIFYLTKTNSVSHLNVRYVTGT